jgi:hypothetical protein
MKAPLGLRVNQALPGPDRLQDAWGSAHEREKQPSPPAWPFSAEKGTRPRPSPFSLRPPADRQPVRALPRAPGPARPALPTLWRCGCIKPRAVVVIQSDIRFDPGRHRLDLAQLQSLSKRRCDASGTLRRDQRCTDGRKFRRVDHGHRLAKDAGAQLYKGARTGPAAGRESPLCPGLPGWREAMPLRWPNADHDVYPTWAPLVKDAETLQELEIMQQEQAAPAAA